MRIITAGLVLLCVLPSFVLANDSFSGRGVFVADDGNNTNFELSFEVTPDGRAMGTILLLDPEGNTQLPLKGHFKAGNLQLEWENDDSLKTTIRLNGVLSANAFRSGAGVLESRDIACRVSRGMTDRDPDGCALHREIARWSAELGPGSAPATTDTGQSTSPEPLTAPADPPECRFDNDCSSVCRGEVLQKRVCNARTDRCEDGVVDDCSVLRTTIGEGVEARTRPMSCLQLVGGALCAPMDGAMPQNELATDRRGVLQAQYRSLRKEYDSLTGQIQALNNLYLASTSTCLNGLAAFSLKNLVEIVTSFAGPPRSLLNGLAEGTGIIVSKLVDAANESRGVQPSGEAGTKIIAEACQLQRDLKTAIPNRINLRESLAVDIRRLAAELKD